MQHYLVLAAYYRHPQVAASGDSAIVRGQKQRK